MLRASIGLCVVVCLSLALPQFSTVQADTVYQGSIAGTAQPGSDLVVTNGWSGASLSWEITGTIVPKYYNEKNQLSNILWTYVYSFTGFKPQEVSHFIIELSDDIHSLEAPSLFFGVLPDATTELKTHVLSVGDIYGVKFEGTLNSDVNPFTVQFVSSRIPVWGDFYAKGGQQTAWNAGFSIDDPTAPAADGSLDAHILRPDTSSGYVAEVPEPGTLIGLLSMGIVGAFAYRLRRRKQ